MRDYQGLALIAPTIERPLAVQRLVRTARQFLPGIRIYIGDQGHPDPFMDEFYRQHGVDVVRVPHDCGVSETRNRLVESAEEEFLLLCDDDFVITPTTRLDDPLTILRTAPDVGVVGGRLHDTFTGGTNVRRTDRYYEMYLMFDRANRFLISFPIHLFAPDPVVIGGVTCYPCDALLNFAVFRRSAFSQSIRWDSRLKSDGEHEDFYLNLKVNSGWRAIYVPTLLAEHERPETIGYQRKRERTGGWSLMMQKWGIEQYLEFGAGLRTIADAGAYYPDKELSRPRFLASRRLSYDGVDLPPPGAFEHFNDHLRTLRTFGGDGDVLTSNQPELQSFAVGPRRIEIAQRMPRAQPPAANAVCPQLVVTTIDRPLAIQRFVRSARARFPAADILVGDQSPPDPFMDDFYREHQVEVLRVPYDYGLSATRNALVERVSDGLFVLCDDDFVFTGETDFAPTLRILSARPDIGIVGGQVKNVSARSSSIETIDWAMMIVLEERARLLAFVPIHYLAPVPQVAGNVQYYPCDAVLNFAVFRRSIFDGIVRWDPRFRSDGEHEDFYLNLKLNTRVRIAYLPSMTVHHHRPDSSGYERKRLRTDGWFRLFEKWGLRQYLEYETGLRSAAAINRIQPQRTLLRNRFYLGGSLRHGGGLPSTTGAFELADGNLLPLHAYGADGDAVFERSLKRSEVHLGTRRLEFAEAKS